MGSNVPITWNALKTVLVASARTGRDGKPEKTVFLDEGTLEGRTMPKNIRFERDGKVFLEIFIKKVTHGKSFSLGTWRLNIPKSFKAVGD